MKHDTQRIWTESQINDSLNLQANLPNVAEYFQRFKSESVRAEQDTSFSKHTYGTGKNQDYFVAEPKLSPEQSELVVFIHGGYWRAFSSNDFLFVAQPFLSLGYRFVTVDYPLCPDVTFSEVVHSILDAVTAIAKNYPNRKLWLVGHSAGAHLAMMTCCANRLKEASRLPVSRAFLISGLFDLAPVARSFLQPVLRLTAEDIESYSPAYQAPDQSVSYDIIFGEAESEIFKLQSADLAKSLRVSGASVRESRVDANHFSILFSLFNESSDSIVTLLNGEK